MKLRASAAVALALALAAMTPTSSAQTAADAPDDDPWSWLEDVNGARALDWARAQNAVAEREFSADPRYKPLRRDLLRILDSRERLPYAVRLGGHYYNFWRDATNPRGLWRRTTPAEYRKPAPRWETVLDLDALAAAENENWVWKGAECLRPTRAADPYRRCMLSLSRGGADATVLREFDVVERRFVESGFTLPEAKSDVVWRDADTLFVATDFGAGSMTTSGYPRLVKSWRRGTPLAAAAPVYEAQATDVGAWPKVEHGRGGRRVEWIQRAIAYWNTERFVVRAGGASAPPGASQLVRVDVPADCEAEIFDRWLLVRTRGDWSVGARKYPGQSLLAIDFDAFMRGARDFDVLYEPGPRNALEDLKQTRSALLLVELDNVRSRLWELAHDGKAWRRTRVDVPEASQVNLVTTYWGSDDYLFTLQEFTTPTTLMQRAAGAAAPAALRSLPRFFEAGGLVTQQHEATSRDGTRVPYFLLSRAGLKPDGTHPTLIYGYGGFENAQLPWYSGAFGKGWFEPGGVFVLANLRGGGEFGSAWHRAAIKENKQRTWDDMAAVAEDLIRRGITTPQRLGIMGGSQGGLLVTTTMTQRPELFGAVVAQVPLTDMLRYHKLLAGASWIGEYGDPDKPEERAWLAAYSPYQHVKKEAKYPRIFLTTSTRDDRVHPGHARKMAARLQELGHDALYFENIEGGHGAAANNEQSARMWAQAFTFLWRELAR
jgi:prolyl oligopeptidase